jgi:hypothetical protein
VVPIVNACVYYTLAGCVSVYNEMLIPLPKCIVNDGRPECVLPPLPRESTAATMPTGATVATSGAIWSELAEGYLTPVSAVEAAAPSLSEFHFDVFDESVYKVLGVALRVLEQPSRS